MRHCLLRIIAALSLLALPLLVPAGGVAAAELQPLEIASKSGVHVFAVEMASTPEEQAKGLMFRRQLPEGQGMLFDFHREQPTSFWMKNTYIPLDMIFIRGDGRDPADRGEHGAALGDARSLRRTGARGARGDRRNCQEVAVSPPATVWRTRSSTAVSGWVGIVRTARTSVEGRVARRLDKPGAELAHRRRARSGRACWRKPNRVSRPGAAAPGHSAAW